MINCSKSKKKSRFNISMIKFLGNVTAQGRNHREDKLLLACDDGSLVGLFFVYISFFMKKTLEIV